MWDIEGTRIIFLQKLDAVAICSWFFISWLYILCFSMSWLCVLKKHILISWCHGFVVSVSWCPSFSSSGKMSWDLDFVGFFVFHSEFSGFLSQNLDFAIFWSWDLDVMFYLDVDGMSMSMWMSCFICIGVLTS